MDVLNKLERLRKLMEITQKKCLISMRLNDNKIGRRLNRLESLSKMFMKINLNEDLYTILSVKKES
jgi:hypothetical protein